MVEKLYWCRDKTSISYFTPDLCRPIFFNFKEEVVVEGVDGYKYWLDHNFIGKHTTVNSGQVKNTVQWLKISMSGVSILQTVCTFRYLFPLICK
jgi:hypothetical protein